MYQRSCGGTARFSERFPDIILYGAKEKQLSKQLPSPPDIPESGSVGRHRQEIASNVVSRTEHQYAVRDETAVVQDDISIDRGELSAFHPEKPAQEREKALKNGERRKNYDGKKQPQKR